MIPVKKKINDASNGYIIGLPSKYDSTSKNYPLLITLHGGGTFGDGSSQLNLVLIDGVARLLAEKKFPASFDVNDQNFSFIIMAPQFTRFPSPAEIKTLITFAKKNYRVDSRRVYLTGLSMGSVLSWETGVESLSEVAAIVPISGVPNYPDDNGARKTAQSGLPVWSFQNEDDPVVSSTKVKEFIKKVNMFNPVLAPKFTLFPSGGHNAWEKATNPFYKEENMNIYEWMLQYKK